MAVDMRSLSREAKYEKRVKVIALRHAGRTYLQIALQVGLSPTGVFDICKRHATIGSKGLRDAPAGRPRGEGRTLAPEQEVQMFRQITDSTPDSLAMPELLWNRRAVSRLIEQRLGIVLPARTLALYLARWGFTACRPKVQLSSPLSSPLNAWLTQRYPLVSAQSNAEGGEISWASGSDLPVGGTHRALGAAASRTAPPRAHRSRRGLSMLSALTNKGQLRWTTFKAPLDAKTLLEFLRRLVRHARKKLFLIMRDLDVPDDSLLQTWVVEHVDAIEVFHLPAEHSAGPA
jgi:hypothetical protein